MDPFAAISLATPSCSHLRTNSKVVRDKYPAATAAGYRSLSRNYYGAGAGPGSGDGAGAGSGDGAGGSTASGSGAAGAASIIGEVSG